MSYQEEPEKSSVLINIPYKKLQEKISQSIKECDVCSKNPKVNNLDGICNKCVYRNIAFHRFYNSNIPVEYWDLNMESNFTGYNALLKKHNQVINNLEKVYQCGYSVCFAGPHGVGKTMTSACILKKACLKNYKCLYTTLSEIVGVLTLAKNEDKYSARKDLTMVDILVIDEFDNRFFLTEHASDLFGKTLEEIVRTRLQNKLPILICTNSPNPVESFTGPMKQSIESLMNKINIFPVLGSDFRKNKK